MQSNTDAVKGAYAAFAKGDIPSVLGLLAADAQWTEAAGGPYGGTFVGPQGVLDNVFMKIGAEWDGYAAIPDEFIANETTVVALGHYRGTFKATGKSFRAPFVHVWKFANGKVTTFVQHTDTVLHRQPLQ
jgi:ketosteroid isomerase-like protein